MGDNRKIIQQKLLSGMHRPETKIERDMKIVCNTFIEQTRYMKTKV
jgi:hypothetical protein